MVSSARTNERPFLISLYTLHQSPERLGLISRENPRWHAMCYKKGWENSRENRLKQQEAFHLFIFPHKLWQVIRAGSSDTGPSGCEGGKWAKIRVWIDLSGRNFNFPNSDHVIYSRELASFLFINYMHMDRPQLKETFLWNLENKTYKLKRSIEPRITKFRAKTAGSLFA